MAAGPRAPCPIRRQAQARPDALALWTPDRRWAYAELDAAVAATGRRLRERGWTDGTRVALRLPRGPSLVVLLWALWREGAVAAPISTRLPDAEVRRATERLQARCLIARDRGAPTTGGSVEEIEPPESLVVREAVEDSASTLRPIHRRATILFTSGSTGRPAPVLHSWANHLYSAKGANANMPLRAEDRWLLSLPLYHVGGLAILVRCALAGAAVAVPGRDVSVSEALGETGASHLSLVATQLRRLLDAQEEGTPGRVRAVLVGGGPIPSGLLRRGYNQGWPLHTSYGSTEMASQITTTPPGAPLADLQTAGRRLPHRRVRIGERGQILVAGPSLCVGVIEGDAVEDPRVDGWYPTGDVGHVDAQGRLHVQGRVDRQFVSGGENIQPEEIEAALEQIDDVERAVVVAVSHEAYGHRPVAFVRSRGSLRPEAWRQALSASLPKFKFPDAMYALPEAAVDDRLKVDHGALRQRAQEE
ncbi:o-succinylbenzoate--CoA ligase [Salinibacter altiplanensis]|uniref:o-succinylbenzoate--CoA ligase n=1 Tax=Salinibacter altiplanensis TaxID=1803181 RepID=UPI000C9F7EAF|nr:o-succinylbenzoate--CoA ligase [Salinibacter altiplanensis]